MANYYNIEATFWGNNQVIDHLTILMDNFDYLYGCTGIDCDEDWLPLIFTDEILRQFEDDYSFALFNEGYYISEEGYITLFIRGKNEPGLNFCTMMCNALGLGCRVHSVDECEEDQYDELIPLVENSDNSLVLRPLSELDIDWDNN